MDNQSKGTHREIMPAKGKNKKAGAVKFCCVPEWPVAVVVTGGLTRLMPQNTWCPHTTLNLFMVNRFKIVLYFPLPLLNP